MIYRTGVGGSSYPFPVLVRSLVLLAVAACGGQSTEAAPPYTPANAPEPPTRCPDEAIKARDAREKAIGEEQMALHDEAAGAAFAHAECERQHFDDIPVTGGDPTIIEDLKNHFQSARNLYGEVVNSQVPRWVVAGHVRLGDLLVSFGAKVHALAPSPGEAPDPETAALDERLTMEAGKAYREGLDAAEIWPALVHDDPQVGAWVLVACRGVDRWQPGLSSRYRVCTRR